MVTHKVQFSYTQPSPDMWNSSKQVTTPFSDFLKTITSYNSNILLAALVSLLLVILFVLLLHFYARSFWSAAEEGRRRRRRGRRRRRRSAVSTRGFHHFHTLTTFESMAANNTTASSLGFSQPKGLDSSVISSIPLFVFYDGDDEKCTGLECVICLSMFEVGEVGRRLEKCGHGFHVECIDMWLGSHSTCPLCRAPVGSDPKENNNDNNDTDMDEIRMEVISGQDDENHRAHDDDDGTRSEIVNRDDQTVGPHHDDRRLSSSSSSSLGCSLKRMLSRNRSDRKVFPSSSLSELNA